MDQVYAVLERYLPLSKLESRWETIIWGLEKSKFAKLAIHRHLILYSVIYFFLIDWLVYYILGPQLCKLAPQDEEAKGDSRVDSLSKGASLKTKWSHMINSFIHAIFVCTVGTWILLADVDNLSQTFETRLFGYSLTYGSLFSVSLGYFTWDIYVCMTCWKIYGPSFLAHAIMAFAGIIYSFHSDYPLTYYVNKFLLFEVSTIFLDMHWFLSKVGYDKSKLQYASDIMGLLAYVLVRIIHGYYSSYQLLNDFRIWYGSGLYVPLYFVVSSTFLQILSHALNAYWFYKLVLSATGKKEPKLKKN